jgi:hypothetical protein
MEIERLTALIELACKDGDLEIIKTKNTMVNEGKRPSLVLAQRLTKVLESAASDYVQWGNK